MANLMYSSMENMMKGNTPAGVRQGAIGANFKGPVVVVVKSCGWKGVKQAVSIADILPGRPRYRWLAQCVAHGMSV